MKIYLDNAATTQLDKSVFDAMTPYLLQHFGNPSSQHGIGRQARSAIDDSRCKIASLLNARPEEIIFTSGGTEADNMAILSAVTANGITNVITTRTEHHAVLHPLQQLERSGKITLQFISQNQHGVPDLAELELLLLNSPRSLVSVMHGNNEIGNLNDIETIGSLCRQYNALFHTDTVQTIGHYRYDLATLPVDFLTASAHKFHGPKGTGFLFCRKGIKLTPLIHGGGQEKALRAGTENIAGIVGLTKALQLAYENLGHHQIYIQQLKSRLIAQLRAGIPGVAFNGLSANASQSLYTVLSISLPQSGVNLLNHFDEHGVAVSGGSACAAGARSHVLQALDADPERTTIRFSFSKFNTAAEIDYAVSLLAAVYKPVAA